MHARGDHPTSSSSGGRSGTLVRATAVEFERRQIVLPGAQETPATDGEIFPRYFRAVSDLVVFEVVRTELEAVLVCAILRDAGVPCMHRVTNHGSGAMDGLTTGGPRAIVIRREHLDLARRVIHEQREPPRPGLSRSIGTVSTPFLAHAVATEPA